MSRFSSDEHLRAWLEAGVMPSIHDAIWREIAVNARGRSFLDLGCWTGLLCQRIQNHWKEATVLGVESNAKAIEAARAAALGVADRIVNLAVTRLTLSALLMLIKQNRVDVLVARRCLPEIFGADLEFGQMFVKGLRAAGVAELFVQGRVVVPNAKNALSSIQHEVEMLVESGCYRSRRVIGQVAYLEAR